MSQLTTLRDTADGHPIGGKNPSVCSLVGDVPAADEGYLDRCIEAY